MTRVTTCLPASLLDRVLDRARKVLDRVGLFDMIGLPKKLGKRIGVDFGTFDGYMKKNFQSR